MAIHAPLQQINSTNVRISYASARPAAGRPPAGLYPKHLEEYRRLPGGSAVLLRPIRPDDEAGLRAGFKKLTSEDVRRRFLLPMGELSARMAAYLTRIDYDRHMALVAIGLDPNRGTDGWGVARLVADPEGARAEFAVVVRSDVQRRGVGSLLLDRLLAYARERAFGQVWGDVLADNPAMLALVRKRGFWIARSPEGSGILRVSKDLSALGPWVQEPFA
jgi:acetyltransferase